jgi:hypothetical protein
MCQALNSSLTKDPMLVHKHMEGLDQSIVQRPLKNEEKNAKEWSCKRSLEWGTKNSWGGEKG